MPLRRAPSTAACAASLATLAAVACAGPQPDSTLVASPPEALERVWVGPEFYANRLQDWRLRAGRFESVQGSAAKPMRTLHLLTRVLDEREGDFRISVRTGPIADADDAHDNTWTGFLIGVGGAHVDYRISALVHHWPAPDGGLIVAMDGLGRLVVRDNSGAGGRKGPRDDFTVDTWPLVAASDAMSAIPDTVDLVLEGRSMADATYRLSVSAIDERGALLESLTLNDVAPDLVAGNVALVSHTSAALGGPGYWFEAWRVAGDKVEAHPERAFGPVMGAMHTLSGGVLKMTAQMGPLGPSDSRTAVLEIDNGGTWSAVASGALREDSYTIPFRVENWDGSADRRYRIRYDLVVGNLDAALQDADANGDVGGEVGAADDPDGGRRTTYYGGTIRRARVERPEFVLASMNCVHVSSGGRGHWNSESIWFPHSEVVDAVRHHDPDLLFFSGDQIYEDGLAGIVREPLDEAVLDYLYHWYLWVWSFRDLTRDVPAIVTPDDHDVYQGNIWGAGGVRAQGPLRPLADNGGYIMAPRWVNAVHATQTSHLPDPVDATPLAQGISVYTTRVEYGGVSFAVLADRMWKSAPALALPEAQVVNGWIQNPDFDPVTQGDAPAAQLLGDRQLAFLNDWVDDWSGGAWMKVMLSQTPFANLATLPSQATSGAVIPGLRIAAPGEYIEGDRKAADTDSNGWPQSGRDRALRIARRGFALHVAGDQHLGSFLRYGLDRFNDGPHAFVVPAVANLWPRRWYPPTPGARRAVGAPAYTGEHLDGFGNRMTVHAVANPVRSGVQPEALYDRVPGYGIVRFERATRDITVEAWPRWVRPQQEGATQYLGWPVTVNQLDNFVGADAATLRELRFEGFTDPVVRVFKQPGREWLYTVRARGDSFAAPVLDTSTRYSVVVSDLERGLEREIHDLWAIGGGRPITVRLE